MERTMKYTLRTLSWLLRYPGPELRAHLVELRDALHAERALGRARLAELDRLLDHLRALPALQAEAEYVELFDRGRRTALHLFEHVHGDSRERGAALVDLARSYESAGVVLAAGELPDWLPVVLEFASTQPPAAARDFLRETAHIVRVIFSALLERGSPYAAVLAAVLDLAGEKAERVELPAEPSIDETWAEPAAFDGCSKAGQAAPGAEQPIHLVKRAAATGGHPGAHQGARA
ncbi:MAG: nitrate reductase molybdenum cofactor assembly chaperone [Rubrivivax sp.]|nr:nitrate reductase molybdenum cofactor assembly chaperone [Rubrivivax sp.]